MTTETVSRFAVSFIGFPEFIRGVCAGLTMYDPEQDMYFVMIDNTRSADEQNSTLKQELAHVVLRHTEQTGTDSKAQEMSDAELDYLLSRAEVVRDFPGCFIDDQLIIRKRKLSLVK